MQLASPPHSVADAMGARATLLAAMLSAAASADSDGSADAGAAGWAHALVHALYNVARAPIIGFQRALDGQGGRAVVMTHARVADWAWEERPSLDALAMLPAHASFRPLPVPPAQRTRSS